MKQRALIPLTIVMLGTIIPIAFAKIVEPEFRRCMQTATDRYQQALVESVRTVNRDMESAFQTRQQAHRSAWDLEDDKAIRDAIKSADKILSNRIKEIRKQEKDREKQALTTLRSEEKTCKAENSSRAKASKSLSRSSQFFSSFTSSSFSSSVNCQDFLCSDGTKYPRCRNGSSVFYQQDPCFGGQTCLFDLDCTFGSYCARPPNCRPSCSDPNRTCAYICEGQCRLKPI